MLSNLDLDSWASLDQCSLQYQEEVFLCCLRNNRLSRGIALIQNFHLTYNVA